MNDPFFFLKKKGQKNLHRNVIDRHSLTFFSFQTSPDGNVTLSILNYVPTIRDAGKYMACRAENPELPDATLEDGWKLEIYCMFFYNDFIQKKIFFKYNTYVVSIFNFTDIPQSVLSLGSSLNGSNIKEGDDVYFECSIRANPKPYKISWRFNVSISLMFVLLCAYVV